MRPNRIVLTSLIVFGVLFFMISVHKWLKKDLHDQQTVSSAVSRNAPELQEFWRAYRMATTLRLEGHLTKATEWYAKALEIEPLHEDTHYYKGLMHWYDHEDARARAHWKTLVKHNPQSSRGWMQLGRLALSNPGSQFYQADSSRTFFQKAYEINPEETGPLLYLGLVSIVQEKYLDAIRYLQAVLGFNESNRHAILLLAYSFEKNGAREDACDLLKRLKKMSKHDPAETNFELEGDRLSPMNRLVPTQRKHPVLQSLDTVLSRSDRNMAVNELLDHLTDNIRQNIN